MDLRELVQESLDANGYDGLYNEVGCGCYGENLMFCGQPTDDCEAAYVFKCKLCSKQADCELCEGEEGYKNDYVTSTGKNFCKPDYLVCQNAAKFADENALAEASENGRQSGVSSVFAPAC